MGVHLCLALRVVIRVSLPYPSSEDCCDPQHAKPNHVPCEGGL